jgi:kynurenine formamidase
LRKKINYSPFTSHSIPLSELLEVAKEQNVVFKQGDILIIRSGWMEQYNKLSDTEKDELGLREQRAHCGVEASKEAIKWHWDMGFAAVAGDTVAYESWPSSKPWGVAMHEVRIPNIKL